jgi:RNA polymerase sigma-70 factor (ECF subfamily)
MKDETNLRTSASLLRRVQHDVGDQAAWSEFVARYGPRIQAWCQHWRLQESDAHDVTQEVLLQLLQKLRNFEYDPKRSFRAWLKTIVHHAWQDFLAKRGRAGLGSGDSDVWAAMQSVEARDDLERQLGELFDREILEEAMARVRERVAPHTWEAFRLLTFEGLRGADVAPRVGMQVTMVYVAKSKVQKMLREEIDALEGREPAP